jgi:site-specific recombinase XerD
MSITHASAAASVGVDGGVLTTGNLSPEAIAASFLAGYSAPTRRAYTTDLQAWAAYLASIGIEPLYVRRLHVDAFVRQGEEHGAAAATLARRLAAISGFYAYAVDVGAIDRSPVVRVRRPRVSEHSPRLGLDRDAVRALLAVASESSDRDHALLCLLALNGARVSEALGSDIADLAVERGHRTLRLRRKGGRRQTVPLAPRTAAAV